MIKKYSNLDASCKTIVDAHNVSDHARQIFWHPLNATTGDDFFNVPEPCLTAPEFTCASDVLEDQSSWDRTMLEVVEGRAKAWEKLAAL